MLMSRLLGLFHENKDGLFTNNFIHRLTLLQFYTCLKQVCVLSATIKAKVTCFFWLFEYNGTLRPYFSVQERGEKIEKINESKNV